MQLKTFFVNNVLYTMEQTQTRPTSITVMSCQKSGMDRNYCLIVFIVYMSYSDTQKVAKCCLYEIKSMLKKERGGHHRVLSTHTCGPLYTKVYCLHFIQVYFVIQSGYLCSYFYLSFEAFNSSTASLNEAPNRALAKHNILVVLPVPGGPCKTLYIIQL